ncbi:unnamed protein product [Gadus morhua 'NCC']
MISVFLWDLQRSRPAPGPEPGDGARGRASHRTMVVPLWSCSPVLSPRDLSLGDRAAGPQGSQCTSGGRSVLAVIALPAVFVLSRTFSLGICGEPEVCLGQRLPPVSVSTDTALKTWNTILLQTLVF